MHTTAKRVIALCSMVVMLVLVAGITAVPALGAANGIYTATATPHYKHPYTGVVEDAGGDGSEVLGQSMTVSATHNKALVEVDEKGNTYVTVRLKLMDSIQNVSFQVDGAPVSHTCMQENYGSNTADFRMRVGSESSVIRCSMYVTAMGRDVIYFITVSGLQSGSGDFIPSITVAPPAPEPKPEEPKPEPPKAEEPKPETPKPTEAKPQEPAKETKPAEPAETEPSTEPVETEKPEETTLPSASTAPEGLQEFDASGNPVETTESAGTHASGSSMGTALWVILGVVAAGGIGFCVWYFCFFKKKK